MDENNTKKQRFDFKTCKIRYKKRYLQNTEDKEKIK